MNPQASENTDRIVFQQDHELPKATSQWQAGETIIDGPHEFTVSDRFDTYDLTAGLFRNDRLRLKGLRDRVGRVVIARLHVQRDGDKIASITADPPTSALVADSEDEADFSAHMNPPETWIDFGPLATDGSVKINREPDRLVVFPYPRDRPFRAAFDLQRLAPAAVGKKVEVHRLSAGDAHDMGPVDPAWENERLILQFGESGVGRYVISW